MGPSQLHILLAQIQLLHACIRFSACSATFMLPHAWQTGRPARIGTLAEQATDAASLFASRILRERPACLFRQQCADCTGPLVDVLSAKRTSKGLWDVAVAIDRPFFSFERESST